MRLAATLALGFLCGCGRSPSPVQPFLTSYSDFDQKISTVANEAAWKASTDVSEQHTGEKIGAESAMAAFRGSPYIIDNTRRISTAASRLSGFDSPLRWVSQR